MPTHTGKRGVVRIGGDVVFEVTSWSIRRSPEQGWAGRIGWRCSESRMIGGKMPGRGETVTMILYPEGPDPAGRYYTGAAIITAVRRETSGTGAARTVFSFAASGPLYLATRLPSCATQ